ncbi:hypothetical protein [Flavobacterium filum]|uniref:hypothetical protein n=1 Tax=Flavobacterium filum TaxID=370974 RepID=UPI0023EFFC94|nr:hypothetical protein [Flavobacterium filum]
MSSFHKFTLMNEWSKYGQWRHPVEWWQNALNQYFDKMHPDKKANNPKVIEVGENSIIFGLSRHQGRLVLSKSSILKVTNPESINLKTSTQVKTKWQTYGPSEYPILYWTNCLYNYLDYVHNSLETLPLIKEINDETIHYKFEHEDDLYIISKWELENYFLLKPLQNNIYSPNTLLTRHFIDIPTFKEIIKLEIYTEIEYPSLVNPLIEDILSKNPQWKDSSLSGNELKKSIYEKLIIYFERCNFVKLRF